MTLPFQQVFLVNGIDAVEGTHSCAPFKTAYRLAVFRGDVQIHGGVHIPTDNIEIEVVREVRFEVTDGKPPHAHASLVTEGEWR